MGIPEDNKICAKAADEPSTISTCGEICNEPSGAEHGDADTGDKKTSEGNEKLLNAIKKYLRNLGVRNGADHKPEGASYHEVQVNFRVWEDKEGKLREDKEGLQAFLHNIVIERRIVPETKFAATGTEWGTVPCNSKTNRCKTCRHIFKCSKIEGPSGEHYIPTDTFNCKSSNVVYVIQCSLDDCKMLYVGETKGKLSGRLSQHYCDIKFKNKTAVAEHFNMPNHDMENHLKVAVLLQTPDKDDKLRKNEEMEMIRRLECHQPKGMNKRVYGPKNRKSSCFPI